MGEVYIYIYIKQQKTAQIINLKKSVARTTPAGRFYPSS